MSETPRKILDVRNLDISFKTNAGTVHAIRGVNIDLCEGETVAIVGESGSGKSVTMKAVMGLLDSNATVNSGEILYTYKEKAVREKNLSLRRKVIAYFACYEEIGHGFPGSHDQPGPDDDHREADYGRNVPPPPPGQGGSPPPRDRAD